MSADLKFRWMRVLFSMPMALGTVLTLFVLLTFVCIRKAEVAVAERRRLQ